VKVDTSFLVVVGIALLLLSAMIAVQLTAAGAGRTRTVVALLELWVLMGIWIIIFSSVGAAVGAPAGSGGIGELRDLASRLAELPRAARVRLAVGLIVSVGLAAHLIWSLGRAGGPPTLPRREGGA
jgi:hypothetical protein